MNTTPLELENIYELAYKALSAHGCDHFNADSVATTVSHAERDGSVSHGLFRIPGYVASLKSKKVNGVSRPSNTYLTQNAIRVEGDYGFAPVGIKVGLPELIKTTNKHGVGVLTITNTHHFAALWHETEALAENNLIGIACTAYKPSVAPAGAKKAFFGTNPISMAWPRNGQDPVVFDMATATMAKGEVMIAARDGHTLYSGVGLDENGEPSNDPKEILKGVLLPFGGYKGSAISLMVELFAAGLTGDVFSYEAQENDNNDGGPPSGGQFIMAFNPQIIAGPNWEKHCENFFQKLTSIDGVRLPGSRRYKNRSGDNYRSINEELLLKVRSYL